MNEISSATLPHLRPSPSRSSTLVRVLLFLIATFAILVGVGMFRAMAPADYRSLAWGLVSSLLLVALSFAFLRWDKRDGASVGLGIELASWRRLLVGMGIGFALHALQTATLLIFGGGVTLAPTNATAAGGAPASVILALFTFFALACMEELGFRGYALRRLDESVGRTAALLIGALAFALLHVSYGWSLGAALIGASTGALLFGFAALVSGGLAVPIGLHFAWNFWGWAIGEKDTPGLWHVVVSEQNAAHAQTVGSTSYVAVILLGCVGIWLFGRGRAR